MTLEELGLGKHYSIRGSKYVLDSNGPYISQACYNGYKYNSHGDRYCMDEEVGVPVSAGKNFMKSSTTPSTAISTPSTAISTPSIFGGLSVQTILIIGGAVLLLFLLTRKK